MELPGYIEYIVLLYLREGMPAQGNLNLNICEAHAFNTSDKFTLDVFVVNGWSGEVRWDTACTALCSFL